MSDEAPTQQKLFQTQLLQKIFGILTSIDDSHLEAFILAIFRKYESKDFSTLEQFRTIFNVTPNDFSLLIQSIIYIYETALFHNLTPSKLNETLNLAQCSKSQIISLIWKNAEECKAFKRHAREYSLNKHATLNQIDWRLGIRVSDDLMMKRRDMYAQFALDVGSKQGKLEFGLDQYEMYEFFQKLEQIQSQLDQLSEI